MNKIAIPVLIAAVFGALAYFLIEPYGADQEHWDNPLFWRYAYTGICIGCVVLGFYFPAHAWLYGIVSIWVQGLPVILGNLNAELIGVSIFLLGIISIPPALAGLLGAFIGKRRGV